MKKVKAAEHEKRAKSDANLAAHKALGGDKAKWARWSKSNAGGTKKGVPSLPASEPVLHVLSALSCAWWFKSNAGGTKKGGPSLPASEHV